MDKRIFGPRSKFRRVRLKMHNSLHAYTSVSCPTINENVWGDQFTGQGVEKTNDDIKLIYHRKTNKHAATSEALRVRYRKYLYRNVLV